MLNPQIDDPRIARLRDALTLGSNGMAKRPAMVAPIKPAPVGPDIAPQAMMQMPPQAQGGSELGSTIGSALGLGIQALMNRKGGGMAAGGSNALRAASNANFGAGIPKFKLPGFARGGKLDKHIGKPVVVGENGAEVIIPTAPATVIPNHQLGAMQNQQQVQPAQRWTRRNSLAPRLRSP